MSRPHDGSVRRSHPPGIFSGHRPSCHDNQPKPYSFHRNPNHPSGGNNYRSSPRPSTTAMPQTRTNPPRFPFNFLISLLIDEKDPNSRAAPAVITECAPDCGRIVYSSGKKAAASLYFSEWGQARSAMTRLWDRRLKGDQKLIPQLQSYVLVPSDSEELRRDLGAVFADYVRGLICGEVFGELKAKVEVKRREIEEVSKQLKAKKGNRFEVFKELRERKSVLVSGVEMMEKRLGEFKAAMRCILKYVGGGNLEPAGEEEEQSVVEEVEPFLLQGEVDWVKIHYLILREMRRLEDGLPIYAHRREILARIRESQIIVLIGETGSGKSTQLVQFLADSGIGSGDCVVCTQPRKIAAITIADRVKGECHGCYKDDSVVSYPAFSSDQNFGAKITYATDHCLLQHFIKDSYLSGISCIVIDEAHERSLSTDLLLALIKRLLLDQTRDLRLVIMSATADAYQLSDYFFGCDVFHVSGRKFPVDVRYIPCNNDASTSGALPPHVYEVVNTSKEIHKTEKEGTILAFLTSQMEVEWACDNFEAPMAIALPLHGKLSREDQHRIFHEFPGKRKVIFATNLAETSLTIPGVKYVVDSGLVKESRFESGTGMSMLKICRISQSSAQQRAGRAGRTGSGICYRLYTEHDFELMPPNQEPEIRRVHLGIAVLRILALGVKNINEFNFVDAPSPQAIDMAIKNLVQLGAIRQSNGMYELTRNGRVFVRLGIEPRLGKLILHCFNHGLGKEGLALAAVMVNAGSIFCRIGNKDDKIKADCLKVQFCHQSGDLFTLLSVFKEWEAVPRDFKLRWCWENSINTKAIRRCHESVKELEECLKRELNVIVPTRWRWSPHRSTEHDKFLKMGILSALVENVAMYSGYDQVGYQVAMTGHNLRLHPSCSLQMFAEKPTWVVFGEILSTTCDTLVCVTAFDFESLSTLDPPPLFDVNKMECQKLQSKILTGFGSLLLKRFCGKYNSNLQSLVKCSQRACSDERIGIEVNVDQNEIRLFATSENMEKLSGLVEEVVEYERRALRNECMERHLCHGVGFSSSVTLLGAGAEIKHLELQKRFLTVDIFLSLDLVNDKELLMFIEKSTSGTICSVHKFPYAQEGSDKQKWGRITFLSPDAAEKACQLDGVEFCGSILKVIPSQTSFGSDRKSFSFPSVRAKVSWPRKYSKGVAFVKCYDVDDVSFMLQDFSQLVIGEKYIRSGHSRQSDDSIVLTGIDKGLCEGDIEDAVRAATRRQIKDIFFLKGDAVPDPAPSVCEESLMREIAPFMCKQNPNISCYRVQVFPPEPRDAYTRASIIFDGRLHLEAAKALEHLERKVLAGCLPWQKIKCQQLFHSSLTCCASVYFAIKKQLDSLLESFSNRNGVECSIEKVGHGSFRVKLSANATKIVAELRRPLEELMRGRIINHDSLTQTVLQHLFSPHGTNLMRAIQQETQTYIIFDRRNFNVTICGSPPNSAAAEKKLIDSLLAYHESKQLKIHLKGGGLPPDLMKKVVEKFGPDLNGLKAKYREAEFSLDTRHHVIFVHGSKEVKQSVEELVREIASGHNSTDQNCTDLSCCPICLCEVENGYRLEGCTHVLCQPCLVEQFESAMKNLDSFPVCCAREGCGMPIILTDVRSLLSSEKLEELFRASLRSYVASSGGTYRFCPSPDCPSVYQVAAPGSIPSEPFVCEVCFAETCTNCHVEYHPYVSCEKYREYKEDPDLSLTEWCKGKEHVKKCPMCFYTIEKVDGCNHVECRCGRHVCWVCLEHYRSSQDCYAHLQSLHP